MPGEEAGRQGAEDRHADAFVEAEGQELVLDVPRQQIERRLDDVPAREIVLVAEPESLADLEGPEVGAAEVPDLPLADEVVHGPEGLVERRVVVRHVGVVDVEVVRPEAP